MINSQEITFYQDRIDLLENELTKAKLKIIDLEQQLIASIDTQDSKSVLLLDKSTQYYLSDINEETSVIEVLTADALAEIAESSIAQTNYVYDHAVGMYYDQLSKCYYDAERSLYYEPNSGAYYSYNESIQQYEFHSQLSVQDFNTITHVIKSKSTFKGTNDMQKKSDVKTCEAPEKKKTTDVEEGEILSNDDRSSDDNDDNNESSGHIYLQKLPEMYKSCVRAVVKSSDCLNVNSLFVLTCRGASIGRDKSLNHDIILSDPTVSRNHCSIKYDEEAREYFVTDEGSFTGTYINDKRIGRHKEASDPFTLQNLTRLKVGNSIFELHIHPCQDTCPGCEPWNLKIAPEEKEISTSVPVSKDQQRRQQLKMIKKKYGLKNMNYEKHPSASKLSKSYVDRSKKRRSEVGSDGGLIVDALPASVNRPLSESNIGHKLLTKMGWRAGKSLGKSQVGILEPIQAEVRVDERAGMGRSSCVDLDSVEKISKLKALVITKNRYERSTLIERDPKDVDCGAYDSES